VGPIGDAAWRCADPGVQFDTTINAWHTCPSAGRINASNPCSEYMFLDNTACNLASLNVLKFYDSGHRATFDVERYEHGVDLWTIVLEISVLMAAFPSKEIAELSYKYRTLGLGYANLGAMLMQAGIPYDSEEAARSARAHGDPDGRSYRMSALMAKEHGAFPGYEPTSENMLRVIRNHRRRPRRGARQQEYEEPARSARCRSTTASSRRGTRRLANAEAAHSRARSRGTRRSRSARSTAIRNAQTTVIAPTGTIGLLMDCDTTGVEPDFALVKFKKLAGGGYFKIANESVEARRSRRWGTRYADQGHHGATCWARSRSRCRCPAREGRAGR
jgi:ribonucleoside-diphosphate reductase alpha chain